MVGITIGSLFSGGCDGIALGLQWLGLGPLLWHAESDPWRRRVLARHWPDAVPNVNVSHVGVGSSWVDMIVAGFPCQPWSHMGKQRGFDDDRSLWPEVARALGDLRPPLAFLENVDAVVSRGWCRIVGELTELGFDTEWCSLRGTDVGYPVGRERVFLLACAGEVGREKLRAAHDLDRGHALWDLVDGCGACRPPPGPGDGAALQAWSVDHGGRRCGVRRDVAIVPGRVVRVGALGDSAMPVLVAAAFRQLSARFLSE